MGAPAEDFDIRHLGQLPKRAQCLPLPLPPPPLPLEGKSVGNLNTNRTALLLRPRGGYSFLGSPPPRSKAPFCSHPVKVKPGLGPEGQPGVSRLGPEVLLTSHSSFLPQWTLSASSGHPRSTNKSSSPRSEWPVPFFGSVFPGL